MSVLVLYDAREETQIRRELAKMRNSLAHGKKSRDGWMGPTVASRTGCSPLFPSPPPLSPAFLCVPPLDQPSLHGAPPNLGSQPSQWKDSDLSHLLLQKSQDSLMSLTWVMNGMTQTNAFNLRWWGGGEWNTLIGPKSRALPWRRR